MNGSLLTDPDFAVVPLRAVLLLVEQLCPDCASRCRAILAERLPGARLSDKRPLMTEIVHRICYLRKVSYEVLMSARGTSDVVQARIEIANEGRRWNYTVAEIAASMKLHHTTVLYYLHGKGQANESEREKPVVRSADGSMAAAKRPQRGTGSGRNPARRRGRNRKGH